LSFDASYARMIGEFETAESILERALSLYLAVGDTHLQGRTLIQMGTTIGYVDPDRGIGHLERGLRLIDPLREPRLELCAQHGLAFCLTDADRPQEALAVLDRARALYKQFTDEWMQLRLHWVQGRIACGLRQYAEAVHILRQVLEEFRARDLHMEFLMVALDLAEAHVAGGEIATAGRLLTEVTPLLTSWNLRRNAVAAWLMYRNAFEKRCSAGAAETVALFGQLRIYYLRYWHVPNAEFAAE